MNDQESDLWILTFTTDTSDPCWGVKHSIVGKPELLASAFNLDALPEGVRLLKTSKQVKRYIKQAAKEERQYYREQQIKGQAGGMN